MAGRPRLSNRLNKGTTNAFQALSKAMVRLAFKPTDPASCGRPSYRRAGRFFGAIMAALFLGACASSSPMSRITNNPAVFESLSQEHRELVATGVIRQGMTQDAVFLAWGRPDRVSRGHRGGQGFETWTYLEFEAVRRRNLGVGFGYGGHGYGRRHGWPGHHRGFHDPFYGGGSTVDYIPVIGAEVVFIGGRVSEWEVRR